MLKKPTRPLCTKLFLLLGLVYCKRIYVVYRYVVEASFRFFVSMPKWIAQDTSELQTRTGGTGGTIRGGGALTGGMCPLIFERIGKRTEVGSDNLLLVCPPNLWTFRRPCIVQRVHGLVVIKNGTFYPPTFSLWEEKFTKYVDKLFFKYERYCLTS